MKQIILTVGPQYVGKSTFCKQIIKSHPEIILVSRDAILEELFGSAYLDSYSGGHAAGLEKMWQIIAEHAPKNELLMILDCCNGSAEERKTITQKIRLLGFNKIGAWYFITPEVICSQWYLTDIESEFTPKSPEHTKNWKEYKQCKYHEHYQWHHSQLVNNDQGFDYIIQINPLEPPLFESLFQL